MSYTSVIPANGLTLWFTGLPCSGKTTLAVEVAATLQDRGCRTEILDGDELRSFLSPELGFTKTDRDLNVRRLGFIAELLARNGVTVLVAAISPYRTERSLVRARHRTPFIEIFVDCDLTELTKRDVKGLYSRALRGELPNFTGVSDPYEPPEMPELHIATHEESLKASAATIIRYLDEEKLLPPRSSAR